MKLTEYFDIIYIISNIHIEEEYIETDWRSYSYDNCAILYLSWYHSYFHCITFFKSWWNKKIISRGLRQRRNITCYIWKYWCFLNLFISLRWLVLLTVIVGTVLGTLSLYYFVGNKNPRAASILAIVSAVIIPLDTLLSGFIPAILFLIAGVMGLMRKTSNTPYAS